MYTTGEIAAELCLEKPGLDTLDIAVFWGGSPTIASTQTILVNAASVRRALPRAEPVRAVRPRRPGSTSWSIPGQHELGARAAVGRHLAPGVVQATTRGWPTSRRSAASSTGALMLGVPQIVAAAIEATKDMAADEQGRRARRRPPRQVMNEMPPRENPRINKSLDSVHASGPLGRAHCVIHGN